LSGQSSLTSFGDHSSKMVTGHIPTTGLTRKTILWSGLWVEVSLWETGLWGPTSSSAFQDCWRQCKKWTQLGQVDFKWDDIPSLRPCRKIWPESFPLLMTSTNILKRIKKTFLTLKIVSVQKIVGSNPRHGILFLFLFNAIRCNAVV
jgi:hypothetical protein